MVKTGMRDGMRMGKDLVPEQADKMEEDREYLKCRGSTDHEGETRREE